MDQTLREQAGWVDGVCGECDGPVEEDMPKVTDTHPALCRKCMALWYPGADERETS